MRLFKNLQIKINFPNPSSPEFRYIIRKFLCLQFKMKNSINRDLKYISDCYHFRMEDVLNNMREGINLPKLGEKSVTNREFITKMVRHSPQLLRDGWLGGVAMSFGLPELSLRFAKKLPQFIPSREDIKKFLDSEI